MKSKFNLLTAATLLAALCTGFGQPVITTQPRDQTSAVGTTATFWVVATATGSLAYQWQKLGGNWSDLTGCTDTNLCLTNVQTSHAGDYRVVLTNVAGAVTSDVAHLTVIVPPRITPTASLQHTAVFLGSNASFTVTASGTAPLAYRWLLDGHELLGQTDKNLAIIAAQPADEGRYSVAVTNLAGAVTSEPARLWVVPLVDSFIRGNFTNSAGRGLPYFYWVPTNYNAARTYPLFCNFHGSGDDVSVFLSRSGPERLLLASYKLQATDPVIFVCPTRWHAGEEWTEQYLQLTSGLLDQVISQFNIDTNRVYVDGYSEGVHAAWDLMGMRPGFFAAADVGAGWMGNTLPVAIKNVPLWVACAADDEAVGVSDSRTMATALRRAGGNPIYTEYSFGGHVEGVLMHVRTPAMIDWFLAQRRGMAPTNEPLLSITSPGSQSTLVTGATKVSLAGSAGALGRDVISVTWWNTANAAKGTALGSNTWSVTGIPLVANRTNLIIVTATTTSWASFYRGNTTFNDTLTVIQSPIRATLTWQGTSAILNWTGGGSPYHVQRAADLVAGDWADLLTNATPPVTLPVDTGTAFFRIVGQ